MKSPNLLFIVVDQLRFDSIGVSGKYPIQTPNIDSLAQKGIRFTEAYTTIPTCCPARQSLLTGRTAEDLGALWNYDITLPVQSLTPNTPTWSKELHNASYHSAYIGKWHCSENHTPLEFGFDTYYGEHEYAHDLEEAGYSLASERDWRGGISEIPLHLCRTHRLAEEASTTISRFASEQTVGNDIPWFIHLDFPEPHLPCYPTREFADYYSPEKMVPWEGFYDDLSTKPLMQLRQLSNWDVEDSSWDDWKHTVARYFAIITQMDDAIGQIINTLKKTGQAESTLIIFTSDHGDLCGSHRLPDKHYVMYDDVVRIPLIMNYPGVIPPGIVSSDFISHTLDIPRTMMTLLNLPPLPGMRGKDFTDYLLHPDEQTAPLRDCVIATYNGAQFGLYCQRMIRTREWKYIWNPTDLDELYHLSKDPGELINLIDNREVQPVLKELKLRLNTELCALNDPILLDHWLAYQLTGIHLGTRIKPTI